MILGVLPAVGSGLATMARAGQLRRLAEYMRAWSEIGGIEYFSWLQWETEEEHVSAIRGVKRFGIDTLDGRWPWWRAFLRPLRQPQHWRDLSILRCLNLLAAVPALTANAVWGVPFVVSLGADYPTIARIHGHGGQAWKWRLLRALVLRRAAAVIVPNPVQAARLAARCPWANVVALPNWVDTDLFRPAEPWTGDGCRRVYYWGRLVQEKNLVRAVRACKAAGATLCCIGEGPEREWLAHFGAAVVPPVPYETLPTWIALADAFILPSLSEGHPKALLEAMSMGLPCLVSDRVEGVIEHEKTGLVFGAEDSGSMREAVVRVLADPAMASRLGEAARAETVAKYAKGPILEREVALLKSLVR